MASNENRILILGAAGRDFHNFNTVYRDDPSARVVAFTATQIPGIAGRRYPAVLAGPRYPQGIPIVAEEELSRLIREETDRHLRVLVLRRHPRARHAPGVAVRSRSEPTFFCFRPDGR